MYQSQITSTQLLFGHTSLETAYKVEDYPYGFRERTSIFYWIESVKGKGDRFCSVTTNPKTGRLNKPKKSTYSTFLFMYLNDEEHVKYASMDAYKVERMPSNIDYMVNIIGLVNISPIQQANIRVDYVQHLAAGYGWVLVKYKEESKQLYTDWIKAHIQHIKTAPFDQIGKFEPAPTEDNPEGKVEFVITSTGTI